MNSPAVKEFGESRVRKGELCLVIDLEACTGMDSTFMGTLAGLASRLKENKGRLQVANTGERNRNSLEDLGLDFLMDIEPEEAVWRDVEEKAKDFLKTKVAGMKAGTELHTRHVLEAHQILSDANVSNRGKFSGVVKMLGDELAAKSTKSQ
jgi:anti-anti-sigma regulatory factor